MTNQLWWYAARAGGLLAWALLSASVLWGLALSSRIFGRRPRPAWLLDLHRYLGGLTVVFVAVHVAAILLDSYVHFGPAEVLVPFTGSWHPVAVAWGIVAGYLLLAVELTSLLRKHLPLRVWRRIHYASFPLFVFSTVHLLTAGTDRGTPAVVISVVAVCVSVAMLVALRARPTDRTPIQARTPARAGPPAPAPSAPPAPARARRDVVALESGVAPPPPPRRREAPTRVGDRGADAFRAGATPPTRLTPDGRTGRGPTPRVTTGSR